MNTFWLIGLGLGVLFISGLWLFIPALYGVPWVPTREKRIRKAMKMVDLQPGETLYDLGAGDGRVLILAAREFGAQGVGIEIGPVQCLLGWMRILLSGSRHNARLRCGDFNHAKVMNADVVFVYLTSKQTARLQEKLTQELRPGTRVVSIAAEFPGWQLGEIDREMLIFVYEMPPLSGSGT